MEIAVVTGASSGIGEEFVRQLEQLKPDEIWVIARRRDRLVRLEKRLFTKLRVLTLDLQKEASFKKLRDLTEREKPSVKWLVNCAGYGIRGEFKEGSFEEEVGMTVLNCQSLTAVTHLFLPYMPAGSHIINAASAAAFLPQPGFAVYSASKAYVLSFSRALHRELKRCHISVTAVCPGPVDTEFFLISDRGGQMPAYKKLFLAQKEKVVEKALKDAVKYRPMSVYGLSVRLLRLVTRFI